MIYVPSYNTNNCVYVRDSSTIRVYLSVPTNNSTIGYTDYYINSHYVYTTGSTTFNNYQVLPTCLASSEITTNIFYRNDLSDIMICVFIMLTIGYFIIKKVVRSFLYGGRFA